MSRTCSLNTQTGKLFIVIRKPADIMANITQDKVESYCKTYGRDYVFICHDHDVEPVTGLIESKHYHIVLNAINKDKRLSTHLNDLCAFFEFDNNDGICIEKYDSYEGSLQYLIHKNQPEKTQHDFSELVYNIDTGDLKTYLTVDLENDTITFDRVYSVCLSSNNIVEVIRALGISNYQRYRSTVWDIWQHIQTLKR